MIRRKLSGYEKPTALIILLAIAVLALGVVGFPNPLNQAVHQVQRIAERLEPNRINDQLVIACATPLSGDLAPQGRDACDGAESLIDKINSAGGINGHSLRLERLDTQADPETAEAIARQIGVRDSIVAVIGNMFSSTSIPAGEFYAIYGVPAVTGFATNPAITADNPWYFRVIFNDTRQGDLAAIYSQQVLGHQRVACIGLDNVYGEYLSAEFSRQAAALGIEAPVSATLPVNATPEQIAEAVTAVLAPPQVDAVFLAMYGPATLPLVKALRQAGFSGDILGSDSVEPDLREADGAFAPLSNGTLLVTPYTSETGSVAAHRFEQQFLVDQGRIPTWYAYFAYDAALAIVTALKRALALRAENADWETGALRQSLRDQLGAMDSAETGVSGLTGPIYFDAEGDAPRPIYFSRVKYGKLMTAERQLTLVTDPAVVADFGHSGNEEILLDATTLIEVTQVVRTGLRLTRPIAIDPTTETFEAWFDLWFRAHGRFDPSKITFIDALEPISLGRPTLDLEHGDEAYRVYSVHGRFSDSPSREQLLAGYRNLAIRYLDPTLDRARLILVPDRARMELLPRQSWGERLKREADAVVSPRSGWELVNATIGQDDISQSTLGNPLVATATRLHSVLDASLEVKRHGASIQRFLNRTASPNASWPSAMVLVLLLGLASVAWLRQQRPLPTAVLRLFLGTLLLLLAERIVARDLIGLLTIDQLDVLMLILRCLWWLLPAAWIIVLLPHLVWRPLERGSGYPTPIIARILTNFVVIAVTVLWAAAVEFNFDLGSISLISGALTIVIGIALQSLILDLFSGILLNIERPFQVGHWLEVNSRYTGQVYGKVIELHWRTTRLWTRDNDIQVIPNSLMNQARLTNFSLLSAASRLEFPVTLDFSVPPQEALCLLTAAAEEACKAKGMLTNPPPKAVVDTTGEHGILYKVQVHHNHNLASRDDARTATLRAVHDQLSVAGITFSFPVLRVEGDLFGSQEQQPVHLMPHVTQSRNADQG